MGCSLIYAQDLNRGIGYKGDLPWPRISVDLQRFKELTSGGTVIMGRNTYESIGRPLPERQNIVVTSSSLKREGLEICRSISEAVETARREVFFIGGVSVYAEAVNLCQRVYETVVQGEFICDRFLPFDLLEGFLLYNTEDIWAGDRWVTFNEYRRANEPT